MSETTDLMKIPYPAEDSDPFWDAWVEMMNYIDRAMFFQKIMANLFIGGGGTRSWNGVSGALTWTSDFVIPVYHWGKRILVRFGPDGLTRALNLADGQFLMVTIPASMNADVVVNFEVRSQLDQTQHNQWVAGWRIGDALQLKGIGELT